MQARARQGSGFISEDNLNSVKNRGMEFDTPLLQLREMEGNMINPEIIKFSHFGMIGGLRNQRDGFAYFGYKKMNSQNRIINDFILNNPNNINTSTDNLFKIWYSQGKENTIKKIKRSSY